MGNDNVNVSLENGGMTRREIRLMETYTFYHLTALSCDYSRSAAATSNDVIFQVTARAIKVLSKQEVWLVSFDEYRIEP